MTNGRKLAAAAAGLAVGAFGMLVTQASADPPTPQVGPHQHYVVRSGGDPVPVGPNACEDGMSIQFDNFHLNGHVGEPGQHGVIIGSGCP